MTGFGEFDKLFPVITSAGKMMLGARDAGDEEHVHAKSGTANFVTDYDVAVQNYVISETLKLFPGSVFLAEEKNNDGEDFSGTVFVLDPIDGTTNFMHGLGVSAISLAAVRGGETVFGVIYDPYRDETFCAAKGKGSYLNGRRINVSTRGRESMLTVFGTCPYYKDTLADATFEMARRMFMISADIRRSGSAALDLAYVACGRYDVFFEFILQPWDIAAGILLVREAGGVIRTIEDGKISPLKASSVLAGGHEAYKAALEAAKEAAPAARN